MPNFQGAVNQVISSTGKLERQLTEQEDQMTMQARKSKQISDLRGMVAAQSATIRYQNRMMEEQARMESDRIMKEGYRRLKSIPDAIMISSQNYFGGEENGKPKIAGHANP